jgi:hypothetical protein
VRRDVLETRPVRKINSPQPRAACRDSCIQRARGRADRVFADGAANIRIALFHVFGTDCRIILDWFHLAKKVNDMLSMAMRSSDLRKAANGLFCPISG